ncbi:MAG: DUF4956 domain-containing protein [Clostridia bacterium]|nr:DUF4956 domain-containing protein [Clostridia bacterium]
MFDSVYSTVSVTAPQFFIMAGCALAAGLLFSWLISFRIRSTKRFFTVAALVPFAVAVIITFVHGNIGAGVAVGGAFALVRFRSAQGRADEIAAVLMGMCSGIAFGMGYVAYGVIILLGLAAVFFILSLLKIFDHKCTSSDRLLRITIPESLEYADAFDGTFKKYLRSWESLGVKTVAMGSMFRLSFRIQMKDASEEKAFVDEIRTINSNLEIAILPYTEVENQL